MKKGSAARDKLGETGRWGRPHGPYRPKLLVILSSMKAVREVLTVCCIGMIKI